MKNNYILVLKSWLPLALTIVMLSGIIYTVVQQNYRMNANDPQIQIAGDYAINLESGKKIDPTKITGKVDTSESLSPFVIFYDANKKLIVGTVQLDGASPKVPDGVLDSAKKKGEARVTWEPKKGVRSAIVVKYFTSGKDSGYIVVGRSLKEIEIRENDLLTMVVLGMVLTLIATYITAYLIYRQR